MSNLKPSKSIYVDYNKSLKLIKTVFLMWGFITVVNSFLLTKLMEGLHLDENQSLVFTLIFYATYFLMGIPSAVLINKKGYKESIKIGLFVAAASVFLMVPGARMQNYGLVIAAVAVLASGFTVLQVACNPYIIFLGKPETGAARLCGAGAYNSFGTWLAPLFGTMIASITPTNLTDLIEIAAFKTEAIVTPYVLFSVIFVGLAIVLNFSDLPEIETKEIDDNLKKKNVTSILEFRHLILAAIAIFCYVGAEVAIGENIARFIIKELDLPNLTSAIGYIIPYYWGGAMVGRFIGETALDGKNNAKTLLICAIVAILLIIIAVSSGGYGALFAMLAIGLMNSIMWPVIFGLGIHGLGRFSAFGSAIMIMGILGGAAALFLVDFMVDHGLNLRIAFLAPILCYIYIIFFAVKGHKYNKKEEY